MCTQPVTPPKLASNDFAAGAGLRAVSAAPAGPVVCGVPALRHGAPEPVHLTAIAPGCSTSAPRGGGHHGDATP